MDSTDRELYDQLLGYLAAEGSVEEDVEAGVLVLYAHDHRPLRTPLRLHLTAASLGAHLRSSAASAGLAFSEVPALDASWRLFLVHLDEAVQTAKPGETELVLDPAGVVSRPRV